MCDLKNIYLDNAATTKPYDDVVEEAVKYMSESWYNPSSLYSDGTKVSDAIKHARGVVSNVIGCSREEIYFTSGACESNSWVIRGWDDTLNRKYKSCIITTEIEHKSILEAVENENLNSDVYWCNVDSDGFVDICYMEDVLKEYDGCPILVSVIMANNEIGVIQDIKQISDLVHKYGGVFHTDATQALPYMWINVEELGIDMLSASAQKFGGLKGTGFLYKKNGIDLMPLIYGSQENGMRGGTENVIGIMAMAKALEHIDCKRNYRDYKGFKRDYFIKKLENIGCKLNGSRKRRLPNNINVVLPHNTFGESILYMLDMSNIKISTGSACNSKSIEPSYVLKAIGLSDEEAACSIRITLEQDISLEDIDYVVEQISTCIQLSEFDC